MRSPRMAGESDTQTYELSLRELSAEQVDTVFALFAGLHAAALFVDRHASSADQESGQ